MQTNFRFLHINQINMILRGDNIKKLYGEIRGIVPTNINLENAKEYEILENSNEIRIYHCSPSIEMIYLCEFKAQTKQDGINN